jgi:hypothetical protein
MILKLSEGPVTMVVRNVAEADGKFGKQHVFTSEAGDLLYISEAAGSRGLARINLDFETVVGQTLTFSQVKKDSKTYTNIDKGGTPGAAPAPATRTTSTAAPASALSFEDAVALYAKCVEAAVQHLGKACEQAEIPVDGAAIQSAAATLFIRTSK